MYLWVPAFSLLSLHESLQEALSLVTGQSIERNELKYSEAKEGKLSLWTDQIVKRARTKVLAGYLHLIYSC